MSATTEGFYYQIPVQRIQQDYDVYLTMEISNLAHEAESFEWIVRKIGADQQDVKSITVQGEDNFFRGCGRHRVVALATQQCVYQELAAHGDRICHQDSRPEIRIGDGFQRKSTNKRLGENSEILRAFIPCHKESYGSELRVFFNDIGASL